MTERQVQHTLDLTTKELARWIDIASEQLVLNAKLVAACKRAAQELQRLEDIAMDAGGWVNDVGLEQAIAEVEKPNDMPNVPES